MRWSGGIGAALGLAEVAAVVAAGLVARTAPAPLALACAVALVVARAADLHRARLVLWIVEDLPALLVTAAAVTAVLVVAGDAPPVIGVLVLATLVLAHTAVYAGTHLLRRTGRLLRRVLVLGTGTAARKVALTLLARPELGLAPVGFVATGDRAGADQARGLPLALVGPVTALPRAMAEARVDVVVVALSGPAGDAEAAAVEGLLAAPADVFAVPTWLPDVAAQTRPPAERIGNVAVVRLQRRGPSAPVRAVKRAVEVAVAAVALAVLVPLGGLLALPVYVETGGVLVRRTRVDAAGRPVWVRRFRTRRARSVARPGTTFSIEIPGRPGPVGRVLRRTRLVALPEVVTTLAHTVRHPAGWAEPRSVRSAPPARPDQAQVDAGQLAR